MSVSEVETPIKLDLIVKSGYPTSLNHTNTQKTEVEKWKLNRLEIFQM